MLEEWWQMRSCLFRREDYRNKSYDTEKTVVGLRPDDDSRCSETKHDRMMPRQNLFISARTFQELRSQIR
jgi:hypothetical protein